MDLTLKMQKKKKKKKKKKSVEKENKKYPGHTLWAACSRVPCIKLSELLPCLKDLETASCILHTGKKSTRVQFSQLLGFASKDGLNFNEELREHRIIKSEVDFPIHRKQWNIWICAFSLSFLLNLLKTVAMSGRAKIMAVSVGVFEKETTDVAYTQKRFPNARSGE